MEFIRVQEKSGVIHYLNVNHIVMITSTKNVKTGCIIYVNLPGYNRLDVVEEYDYLVSLINNENTY